ncbi:type II toxin-antitoxin system HipA family toxin [Pseudarthrobacter sp. J1738]|uniref:type II toxin-antitoxin system HipA family toxin n=1 Tax=unclassified Pseudarthrobacter TaxID=2647000 RepID=UPI003D29FDC8
MTTIEVYLGDGDATLVGQAHLTRNRGQLSTTFLYSSQYLSGTHAAIDPALPLVPGAQHQLGLAGAFADSSPDRWGRNLIEKAERASAREENRSVQSLDDLDFLLGVSDDTRQGALRFRMPDQLDFLGRPSKVPQLVSLPELLRASDQLSRDGDTSAAVKQLLDTGTTGLGGARPKASFRFPDQGLGIAKFPHASDQWDVMAWESTALDLLGLAGITTPLHKLVTVGERSVLLLRRFDRSPLGSRIGYISAMTATGSTDGQRRDYADIAESLRDLSSNLKSDQRELFDRAVANVALGNTDDHLRNHGLLSTGHGWAMSPAFDVNPNPDLAQRRSTSIMGADTFDDEVAGLLALADECDLTLKNAKNRIGAVAGHLSGWQAVARKNGIRGQEVTMMAESLTPRLEALLAAAV